MKPLIGRLTPIIIAILVSITLPNQAHATRFGELRNTIQLPPSGGPITDSYYHFMVPAGYFVLNRAYSQQIRHSITINWPTTINWNATITFTGSIGRIDVVDTARGNRVGDLVTYDREYAIYKVTDSGAIQEIVRKYVDGWGRGPESTQSTSFNVGTLETGLYLLRIRVRWEYLYLTLATNYYAYIPFEIIDSDMFLDPPVYFASPGENLSMTAIFDNDDSSSTITASLIPALENPTELPLTVKKISETKYEILYSVPGNAAKNTINLVHARAYYGGKEVLRRYAVIIIGNESAVPALLDLSTVCPFILNPLWAITEQAVPVGCYDNPMDSYTVSGGKVWIPNGSTAVLTNQGNGTITASLRAPSTEGFVPVLYEVDVQDTSGRRFKVSGSQNMIVTSSPDTMYCPPPADGVASMPGSGQGVGVRLFR